MAEAKSRRDTNAPRARVRPKSDLPGTDGADDVSADGTAPRPETTTATEPTEAARPANFADDDFAGFDEEVNSRYEEIKRGGTHISELQQMTMPQLLKTAKEEGITDYT